MWRVQVWEGRQIYKAVLAFTEEEAAAKEQEFREAYPPPHYEVRVSEVSDSQSKKDDNRLLLQMLSDLLNPFNWFR